ncbi:MAG: MFS transporter [Deltaproteobacteria bacterium]|nr:MFS transporter [Deltaproteobacteria bacterium]
MKGSPLAAIFLVVLVDVFGMTLVLPLLAPYAERFHATPFQATLLVSTYAACMLMAGPVLGALSDRFGRKPLLIVSQIGTLIGFVLLARAETLAMLFFARALDGATAGNLSLAQAYVSDRTPPEKRTGAFALIGIAFGLGFFIGPAITASLLRFGYTAPIWLAAAMSATSIVCSIALLEGGMPPKDTDATRRLSPLAWGTYAPYFSKPIVGVLLLEYLMYTLSFSAFTSGFALFAERTYRWHNVLFTPREVGYVFAYAGFLGIMVQGGALRRLVPRFGESRLIRIGFAGNVLGYGVLAAFPSIAGLFAACTITSIANAMLRPSLTSVVSQRSEASEQGLILGLLQSLSSVGAIVAPMLAGKLIEHGYLAGWAALPAVFSLIALVLSRKGSGLIKHPPELAPANSPST